MATRARIRHVYGNVMRLAIPLTLRTRTLVGGVEVEYDTEFTDYMGEVKVRLYTNKSQRFFAATMDGNVASIKDDGKTPIGVYNVEVLCRNTAGEPMRFMGRFLVQVVDATADAGIEAGVEFDAETYALEGAVYFYAQGTPGNDGVGILDITTEEHTGVNEPNVVTITLTDGRSYSFNVLNGTNGLRGIIVNNTLYPLRSDGSIDIGNVIRQHQNLSNYVSESEFNTWIQNYYTRSQVDTLLRNIQNPSADSRIPYDHAACVVLDGIDHVASLLPPAIIPAEYQGKVYYTTSGTIVRYVNVDTGSEMVWKRIDEFPSPFLIYFNRADGKFYTWSQANGMVEVEISGGGTGDVTGVKVGSTTYEATDGVVDISSAIPTKTSDLTNDSGFLTQHQDISGKQDVISDLATIRTNSEKGIANVSTPSTPDGTAVITLVNGDSFTIDLNHVHTQYLKFHLCENETDYESIDPKDASTLYLIPESDGN